MDGVYKLYSNFMALISERWDLEADEGIIPYDKWGSASKNQYIFIRLQNSEMGVFFVNQCVSHTMSTKQMMLNKLGRDKKLVVVCINKASTKRITEFESRNIDVVVSSKIALPMDHIMRANEEALSMEEYLSHERCSIESKYVLPPCLYNDIDRIRCGASVGDVIKYTYNINLCTRYRIVVGQTASQEPIKTVVITKEFTKKDEILADV